MPQKQAINCLCIHPFAEWFTVEYENGECEAVDIKKIEPEGDFLPPEVGTDICCKAKGGSKYSATIIKIADKV